MVYMWGMVVDAAHRHFPLYFALLRDIPLLIVVFNPIFGTLCSAIAAHDTSSLKIIKMASSCDPGHRPEEAVDKPLPPYTVFTRRQKHVLTFILSLTMLASPLTATIYLPLLPLLAEKFNESIQAINLTITLYIVFQALSPLFFATASDHFGRRPILLATYGLYTVASLGLALNKHSYPALLILRALQSLGASAVLAIAFGVVADVCPPAERGSMLGPTQGAANLAVCVGPVLGGWIALRSQGFEWVFWALLIFGAAVWTTIIFVLRETARNVVGNGEKAVSRWNRSGLMLIRQRWRESRKARNCQSECEKHEQNDKSSACQPACTGATTSDGSLKYKLKMANPLAAVRIVFWKDTALVLFLAGSPYAVWYCVQASIPNVYSEVYNFNELQIGLSFLTGGTAVVLGGYINGKLMDWNYRTVAQSIGHSIDRISGDDLSGFPIERARARGSYCLLGIYVCSLGGYGWAIETHAHVSVPLILQFLLAGLCTSFQQTYNALLVDVFPTSPSTAAAASNITRCALSAVLVSVLQPITNLIGRGWFFSLLATFSGGGGVIACWLTRSFGMKWRQARLSPTPGVDQGKEDQ